MLTHLELRKLFKEFWEERPRNHVEVPPIPLVPQNDPTTLFTGSGMQQLVPNLLGEPHPLGKRLYNIQRSFRSQDIEEIGDNRHTTMFEMMGNWSLGDYFKEEQLSWFYEFLTKKLSIDPQRLYVTIFAGGSSVPKDEESYSIWKKLGFDDNHIFAYDDKKNWWSRAGSIESMPAGEVGGPDSEVFFDFRTPHDPAFGKECHPNCDCGRFLEIGNSVFVQYKKEKDGTLSELPNKNVDFGGGLERQLAAANNDPDIFNIDIFNVLYANIKSALTGPITDTRISRIRIFLDHSRALTFLIADGVQPGKNERESVLRKLIRRADDQLNILLQGNRTIAEEIWKKSIHHFTEKYATIYTFDGNTFQIIKDELDLYLNVFKHLPEIKEKLINIPVSGSNISSGSVTAGQLITEFQTTHGVPPETSIGIAIELDKFNKDLLKQSHKESLDKHKDLSRTASTGKFKGGLADHSDQVLKYHTATHLLHQALFDVFGDDIRQEGSNITGDRLRFDFYSSFKPTDKEIKKVEEIINKKVQETLPMRFKIVSKDEAYKIGARSFFREKYPEKVKVYYIGGIDNKPETAYSKEFCGGPHVKNTKEIGEIKIYKLEKIGSNLYRIYAK